MRVRYLMPAIASLIAGIGAIGSHAVTKFSATSASRDVRRSLQESASNRIAVDTATANADRAVSTASAAGAEAALARKEIAHHKLYAANEYRCHTETNERLGRIEDKLDKALERR